MLPVGAAAPFGSIAVNVTLWPNTLGFVLEIKVRPLAEALTTRLPLALLPVKSAAAVASGT